ncbi:hypothetical protein [Pontibacter sp. G13]|uniref:hypothetical protein n=1 Tax=Pontibacter sp. G13 TaxID=3074898 RepID=UPI002889E3EB|nr:hypothetical protein [Pontibacter sp. G13]WNJ18339.1 hypothetical protein RJD25_26090 [Pontibacter sp. G13]
MKHILLGLALFLGSIQAFAQQAPKTAAGIQLLNRSVVLPPFDPKGPLALMDPDKTYRKRDSAPAKKRYARIMQESFAASDFADSELIIEDMDLKSMPTKKKGDYLFLSPFRYNSTSSMQVFVQSEDQDFHLAASLFIGSYDVWSVPSMTQMWNDLRREIMKYDPSAPWTEETWATGNVLATQSMTFIREVMSQHTLLVPEEALAKKPEQNYFKRIWRFSPYEIVPKARIDKMVQQGVSGYFYIEFCPRSTVYSGAAFKLRSTETNEVLLTQSFMSQKTSQQEPVLDRKLIRKAGQAFNLLFRTYGCLHLDHFIQIAEPEAKETNIPEDFTQSKVVAVMIGPLTGIPEDGDEKRIRQAFEDYPYPIHFVESQDQVSGAKYQVFVHESQIITKDIHQQNGVRTVSYDTDYYYRLYAKNLETGELFWLTSRTFSILLSVRKLIKKLQTPE